MIAQACGARKTSRTLHVSLWCVCVWVQSQVMCVCVPATQCECVWLSVCVCDVCVCECVCMWCVCVWRVCEWVCVCDVCDGADTALKTKKPHVNVGNNSNHLSVHQWISSASHDSQQPSRIGFLFLKRAPPPCAVLLVMLIYVEHLWSSHTTKGWWNMLWIWRMSKAFGAVDESQKTRWLRGAGRLTQCSLSNMDWPAPQASSKA